MLKCTRSLYLFILIKSTHISDDVNENENMKGAMIFDTSHFYKRFSCIMVRKLRPEVLGMNFDNELKIMVAEILEVSDGGAGN